MARPTLTPISAATSGFSAKALRAAPCLVFSMKKNKAATITSATATMTICSQIGTTQLPASADFSFPLTATFGVSYRPTSKWNVEVDAEYTDWQSFNTVTIRQQKTPPFPLQQNIPVKFGWEESWTYELGVTRYFDNGWHASAGYMFSETSVPDTYYTPLAADQDRHFFSLGVGRNGKTFDFDVTYQVGYGPGHTVNGSSPSSTPGFFAGQNANGTYTFLSQAVLVSVGMHF